MAAKKTAKQRRDEQQLKSLAKVFEKRGVTVRREKLSRGPAFRVKSGDCVLTGDKYVFVDRRLPEEQQISVLVDYLVDAQFKLSAEELDTFSSQTQSLLKTDQV